MPLFKTFLSALHWNCARVGDSVTTSRSTSLFQFLRPPSLHSASCSFDLAISLQFQRLYSSPFPHFLRDLIVRLPRTPFPSFFRHHFSSTAPVFTRAIKLHYLLQCLHCPFRAHPSNCNPLSHLSPLISLLSLSVIFPHASSTRVCVLVCHSPSETQFSIAPTHSILPIRFPYS